VWRGSTSVTPLPATTQQSCSRTSVHHGRKRGAGDRRAPGRRHAYDLDVPRPRRPRPSPSGTGPRRGDRRCRRELPRSRSAPCSSRRGPPARPASRAPAG
jgi:hypothetical protein